MNKIRELILAALDKYDVPTGTYTDSSKIFIPNKLTPMMKIDFELNNVIRVTDYVTGLPSFIGGDPYRAGCFIVTKYFEAMGGDVPEFEI